MYLQYSVITFSLEKKSNPFFWFLAFIFDDFFEHFFGFLGGRRSRLPPSRLPAPLVNIFFSKKRWFQFQSL